MDISSYVLLSHEQALRRRLDVSANNMANMSTTGFKREQPVFREFVERGENAAVPAAKNTSFVLDHGVVHDGAAGSFEPTGNALDVMIDGSGWLSVETPEGPAYTRAGALKFLESGDLSTAGGQRVLGDGGQPINVPPEQAGRVAILADGTLAGPDGPLGRLAVTVFENEQALEPRGDGLMSGEGGRVLPAEQTKLRAGGIEKSNVQPIVETTNMVEILRAYQTSMRMSESLSDMRKGAIDKLGRFN